MNKRFLVAFTVVILALTIVACGPSEIGTVRGGGWIELDSGGKATFGFTMKCDPVTQDVWGQFQYVDNMGGVRFHGVVDTIPEGFTCESGVNAGVFSGTYRPQPNGVGGTFYVSVTDYGEPGFSPGDEIAILLVGGDYDNYTASGTISGGNIQSFK